MKWYLSKAAIMGTAILLCLAGCANKAQVSSDAFSSMHDTETMSSTHTSDLEYTADSSVAQSETSTASSKKAASAAQPVTSRTSPKPSASAAQSAAVRTSSRQAASVVQPPAAAPQGVKLKTMGNTYYKLTHDKSLNIVY